MYLKVSWGKLALVAGAMFMLSACGATGGGSNSMPSSNLFDYDHVIVCAQPELMTPEQISQAMAEQFPDRIAPQIVSGFDPQNVAAARAEGITATYVLLTVEGRLSELQPCYSQWNTPMVNASAIVEKKVHEMENPRADPNSVMYHVPEDVKTMVLHAPISALASSLAIGKTDEASCKNTNAFIEFLGLRDRRVKPPKEKSDVCGK